jgi:hypothetical protein
VGSLIEQSKLNYIITFIFVFGLLLHFWGIVFNQAAVILNDGKMPVAIFYVDESLDDKVIKHKSTDETTNVKFLTDWIQIRFPEIKRPDNQLKYVYDFYGVILNYPVEGGLNMVSIGDIMRWVGTTVFLLFLLPLIIMIIITLHRMNNERRFNI